MKVHPEGPECCEGCKIAIGMIAEALSKHIDDQIIMEIKKNPCWPDKEESDELHDRPK
jgi:hypothetical protein